MQKNKSMSNKGVADLFKLAPSNLHKLVSGKKYHGGSHSEGRKIKSIEQLEDHSEPMVTVIKKKMVKASTSKRSSVSVAAGRRPEN